MILEMYRVMKAVKNILFIIFSFFVLSLAAQEQEPVKVKTLLKNAKAAIKNNRDQANNEQALLNALGRSDVKDKERATMLYLCSELNRSLNEQENLKLYLKQPYDTLKLFSTILKINRYLLQCDSVEQQMNKGWKYRKDSRSMILNYRSNLLNGGKYLLKKAQPKEAFDYFDMYLRHTNEPMFADQLDMHSDTMLARVSYWATVAANNSMQPQQVLRHIDYAIAGADSALRVSLNEYKVKNLQALGDTASFLATLRHGVENYPTHDFFFLHLMDFYLNTDSADLGLQLCDSLIHHVGSRCIYWYSKSRLYLDKHDYDNCINSANKAIAQDSTLADAYYNKGLAYLNKAIQFGRTIPLTGNSARLKRDRVKLRGLYQYAREPMEHYRALRPQDKTKWAGPLYTIYLNLNLEKEFAEIEGVLSET